MTIVCIKSRAVTENCVAYSNFHSRLFETYFKSSCDVSHNDVIKKYVFLQLSVFTYYSGTGSITKNSSFQIVKSLNVNDLGQCTRLPEFETHLNYSHQPFEHILPWQLSAQGGCISPSQKDNVEM